MIHGPPFIRYDNIIVRSVYIHICTRVINDTGMMYRF